MGGNIFKSSSKFPQKCLVPTVRAFSEALGWDKLSGENKIIDKIELTNEQLAGSKDKRHLGDIDIIVNYKQFYEWATGKDLGVEETPQTGLFVFDSVKRDEIINGILNVKNVPRMVANYLHAKGFDTFRSRFLELEKEVVAKALEKKPSIWLKKLNDKLSRAQINTIEDESEVIINYDFLPSQGLISFAFPVIFPGEENILQHLKDLNPNELEEIYADILNISPEEIEIRKSQNDNFSILTELTNYFINGNPLLTQIDVLLGNADWMKKSRSGVPTRIQGKLSHKALVRNIFLREILSSLSFENKKELVKDILAKKLPYSDEQITIKEQLEEFIKSQTDEFIKGEGSNAVKSKFKLSIDSAAGLLLTIEFYKARVNKKTGEVTFIKTPDEKDKIVITASPDMLVQTLLGVSNWQSVSSFELLWKNFRESIKFSDSDDVKKTIIENFIEAAKDESLILRSWWLDEEINGVSNRNYIYSFGVTIPDEIISSKEEALIESIIKKKRKLLDIILQ